MWSVVSCDALQPRHPSRMRARRAAPSRFWADQEKSGAFGTGSWTNTSCMKARRVSSYKFCYERVFLLVLAAGGHTTVRKTRIITELAMPVQDAFDACLS
jgi:hypothetical protein